MAWTRADEEGISDVGARDHLIEHNWTLPAKANLERDSVQGRYREDRQLVGRVPVDKANPGPNSIDVCPRSHLNGPLRDAAMCGTWG